jgi:hypothetical protein
VLYRLVFPAWKARRPTDELAPRYVSFWLLLLSALAAAMFAWRDERGWIIWLLVALPLYRYYDLILWWLLVLIDRRQKLLASFERNVLLLMGNIAELAVIEVILLVAAGQRGVADPLFDAFFVTTLVGLPPRESAWIGAASAMGVFASLLLFAGGVSLLVGLISERFEEGQHEGITPRGKRNR